MLSDITFHVVDPNNQDSWIGSISEFYDFGSFQRVVIEAYGSRLDTLYGECCSYRWVFLPEYEVGCMQATSNDFFWNTERLSRIISRKDSLSIVHGIHFVLSGGYSNG